MPSSWSASSEPQTVLAEVRHWFFEDYLPTWIGVGSGSIADGSDFILGYWGVPLHDGTPDASRWMMDGDAVVGLLDESHPRLRKQGYVNTVVPDRRITVYHRNGAAIEVIWSRCRGDGSEIERLAVHFEVARRPEGWRVVGIQRTPTAADSLADVWQASD
jgi:hypothetical protein